MIGVKVDCDKCHKLVTTLVIEDRLNENDWYHATIDLASIKLECPHRFQ